MIVAKGYRGRYDNGTGERTGESDKVEQVGVLGEIGSMINGTDGVLGGTGQGAWWNRWSAWMNRSWSLCKGVVEQMRRGAGSR